MGKEGAKRGWLWHRTERRFGGPRKKLFDVTPPVLYAYFIPILSTTRGITPPSSVTYDWMVRCLLPVALLLVFGSFLPDDA